jgi:hypothetical protein
MEDISSHGTKDGNHNNREPVDPRDISMYITLEEKSDKQSGTTKSNREHRINLSDQIVRGCFPHGSGQQFNEPEKEGHFGDLSQEPFCMAEWLRCLAVVARSYGIWKG